METKVEKGKFSEANLQVGLANTGVKFDAIKTMRDIRDQMSLSIANMSFEEEKAHLDKLIAQAKLQKAR